MAGGIQSGKWWVLVHVQGLGTRVLLLSQVPQNRHWYAGMHPWKAILCDFGGKRVRNRSPRQRMCVSLDTTAVSAKKKWACVQICPPLWAASRWCSLAILFSEQIQNGFRRFEGYVVLWNALIIINIDDKKRGVCVLSWIVLAEDYQGFPDTRSVQVMALMECCILASCTDKMHLWPE